MRVIGRKKRKTVRDSGVINGAVTQDAMCTDGWVQKNGCTAGLSLRSQRWAWD